MCPDNLQGITVWYRKNPFFWIIGVDTSGFPGYVKGFFAGSEGYFAGFLRITRI
ncbi:MAG: hypothetical protein MI921_05480 [Cytophagales bacterium]|nr:hypothetical protein [Cytophagales bacterium]